MRKGLLKALTMIVMTVAIMFAFTACGSRLEGTYKCVEDIYDRYIKFSDGKIYVAYSQDDFEIGHPYKIKDAKIQETLFVGVKETDFSLKGDTLIYDGMEYINIKSNKIQKTIVEVAKKLEPFDGVYINSSLIEDSIISIDSKNKSMMRGDKNKSSELDLFYVEVNDNVISYGNTTYEKIGDSIIKNNSEFNSNHSQLEYVHENSRPLFYGVYERFYKNHSDSEVFEYIAVDEKGRICFWDTTTNNVNTQYFFTSITDEYNFKLNGFSTNKAKSGKYQFDSTKEILTHSEEPNNPYTRVEGVSIPNQ